MKYCRLSFGRWYSDSKGVAAIEFAIVAPLLAMMLIAVVNISMGFNRKLELEQAANRAIEKVMQTTVNKTVPAALADEAAIAANVPVSHVTVDYWLECNGTRQSTYDMECPIGQKVYRYLSVKVWDNFKPIFLSRFTGPNADGSWTLWGDAGIRTQ